jgi:hypothetical protein
MQTPEYGPLSDPSGPPFAVPNDANVRDLRCYLSEEFNPFPTEIVFELKEAGHVAAGMGEARDIAVPNRIDNLSKYNWYRVNNCRADHSAPRLLYAR